MKTEHHAERIRSWIVSSSSGMGELMTILGDVFEDGYTTGHRQGMEDAAKLFDHSKPWAAKAIRAAIDAPEKKTPADPTSPLEPPLAPLPPQPH